MEESCKAYHEARTESTEENLKASRVDSWMEYQEQIREKSWNGILVKKYKIKPSRNPLENS